MAGFADSADLDPLDVSTAQTLVAGLQRIHWRVAVVAGYVAFTVVRLATRAIAGAALVESQSVDH